MSREACIVTTEWAEQNLSTPGVVFVEVDEDTTAYDGGHLAGAHLLNQGFQLLLAFGQGRHQVQAVLALQPQRLQGGREARVAGQAHAEATRRVLPQLGPEQFLGEPCGRDTLNAVGLGAAVLARRDAEATIGGTIGMSQPPKALSGLYLWRVKA